MGKNQQIISLQLGNYANYIGAHFWNLQESSFVYASGDNQKEEEHSSLLEVDHDVLYREGLTLSREVTYTPRLVTLDLKGSLGLLPKEGDLYGRAAIPKEFELQALWPGKSQVFKEEAPRKNEFLRELDAESGEGGGEKDEKDIDIALSEVELGSKLYNLDSDVHFWSDYLSARLHPRSVLEVREYQHENTVRPFDMWGSGRELMQGEVGEELEERVRGWAEDCDYLGALQILSDSHDGWGGASASALTLLSDLYPGKGLLHFPCLPPHYPDYSITRGMARLAAASLSLSMAPEAMSCTPLSLARDWLPLPHRHRELPQVPYLPQLPYHSSAVLALALDTATLPLRSRQGPSLSARDLTQGLCSHGRRVTSLASDLPLHFQGLNYFEAGEFYSHLCPLLPGVEALASTSNPLPHSSVVTVRGLLPSALYSKRSSPYQDCPSPSSYLDTCLHHLHPTLSPSCHLFNRGAFTGKPFPHIWSPEVSPTGVLLPSSQAPRDVSVTGVSSLTQLTYMGAGATAGSSVSSLAQAAARLKLAKLHRLGESGLEADEWEEAKERLVTLAECYSQDSDY